MAGLQVGQAYGGVPPTWVWVVGVSPQILEHPTSICDTGVNMYTLVMTCAHEMHKDLCFKLKHIKFAPQFHHIISTTKVLLHILKHE